MSDAQYVIDVASKMVGGNETNAQLDALTAKLTGGGKNADFFQNAIQKVSQELTGASTAATAANKALAEGEAEFSRLERASVQAAKALERATVSKKGGADMAALTTNAWAAADALGAQTEKLRGLEIAAKGATAEQTRLAAVQKNAETLNGHVNKTLQQQARDMKALSYAFAQAGGPVGGLARAVIGDEIAETRLSAILGQTTAKLVMFGIGVAAATAALAAGTAAALGWAISLSDSNRSARLTSEAMQAMHPELTALAGTIAGVARETNMHTDELQELVGGLKDAKVAAADMPAALRAAALAETALGKGGSADFIEQIKLGKKSVAELAATTQTALGGIVAKQMLGLGAQAEKLKQNLGGMFGSLNIDPILEAFSHIVGDFDSSTVLGEQLKETFGSLFQPLANGLAGAITGLEGFVLKVAIAGVKTYLAIKPWIPLLKDVGLVIVAAGAAFALTFVPALVTGAAAAVVALGGLIATAAVAAAPFILIGAAVVGAYEAFTHLSEIGAFISSLSWSDIGLGIVKGIVFGLIPGPVIDAIGNVAHAAINSAKSILGIHSPSTVFAGIGKNTAAGFAGGVEDGAPDAFAAVSGLVNDPANDAMKQAALSGDVGAFASVKAPAAAEKGAAPAAAASGATVTISGPINFYGVKDAEDAVSHFGEMLSRVLEGDAATVGTGEAAAA